MFLCSMLMKIFSSITSRLVHDNGLKHMAKSVKDTIIANSLSVINWEACSPDSIQLRIYGMYVVKKKVGEHHYSNFDKL